MTLEKNKGGETMKRR